MVEVLLELGLFAADRERPQHLRVDTAAIFRHPRPRCFLPAPGRVRFREGKRSFRSPGAAKWWI